MKIIYVEVCAALTANLGDYNNCRPEVRLRAELEDGDDLDTSYAVLMDDVRQKVYDEVDEQLMRLGQSPRYYDGPLYRVMAIGDFKTVVVHPNDCVLTPLNFAHARRLLNGFPLGQCVEKANDYAIKHQYEVFVVENQEQLDELLSTLKQTNESKETPVLPTTNGDDLRW